MAEGGPSSPPPSPSREQMLRGASVEATEHTIARLQDQLVQAHLDLAERDEECNRLSTMQASVDKEIHELTESLFKEAYKMVQDANEKRVRSERLFREAQGKVDVLESEVTALKLLVVSARTPRRTTSPSSSSTPRKPSKSRLFSLGHRRNLSEPSEGSGTTCSRCEALRAQSHPTEVDPWVLKEFASWREKHDLTDREQPFLRRIFDEDIQPALKSHDDVLEGLEAAVVQSRVVVEAVNEEKSSVKQCCVLGVGRECPFRIRLDTEEPWLPLSALARNRIAGVCELWTYLGYLRSGLVRCGVHEAFAEVTRLRRNIALARLGLSPPDLPQP